MTPPRTTENVRLVFSQMIRVAIHRLPHSPTTPELWNTMLVLSDALAEAELPWLSATYRWAVTHGKWPYRQRTAQFRTLVTGQVFKNYFYDWTREIPTDEQHGRDADGRSLPPRHGQLPKELIAGIHRNYKRRYGGIHRAFVILACALRETRWLERTT